MASLDPILHWLRSQPVSLAIRESGWMFPTIESIHVVAICLVVGSIAIVDLRLMGLASRRKAVTELTRDILPWTWGLFAIAATSGSLMFIAKAPAYVADLPFRLKMMCLLAAGLNMAVFHLFTFRGVRGWDTGPTPLGARVAGAISMCLWMAVVSFGRWIGFTIIG